MVEMAFILPLLLVLTFGIIDLGYYVYGYATIYQAARNGSDTAAYYPPFPSRLDGGKDQVTGQWIDDAYDMSDKCVQAVVQSTQKGAVLMDLDDIYKNRDHFTITYHPGPGMPPDNNDDELREPGKTIQVAITHTIEPLTPLFGLVPVFGNEGKMTVYAKSMRTILGQGESLPLNEAGYDDNLIICRE